MVALNDGTVDKRDIVKSGKENMQAVGSKETYTTLWSELVHGFKDMGQLFTKAAWQREPKNVQVATLKNDK